MYTDKKGSYSTLVFYIRIFSPDCKSFDEPQNRILVRLALSEEYEAVYHKGATRGLVALKLIHDPGGAMSPVLLLVPFIVPSFFLETHFGAQLCDGARRQTKGDGAVLPRF